MTFLSRLYRVIISLGLGLSISACGQKGPLVVPAKPAPVSTPYPTASHTIEKAPVKQN